MDDDEMNIKELAEQAGLLGPTSRVGNAHEAAERFAELIEQWARADERDKCAQDYLQDCCDAVEAARQDEREACAKLCDELASDWYDQYKGRGKYEPNNPNRADPHFSSMSDGATVCADAIRQRGEK